MEWLQQQWEQSNIISGVLAIAIWGAIIYLSIAMQPIPEILYYGGSGIIAFFFGAKIGQESGERRALVRMADERREVNRG